MMCESTFRNYIGELYLLLLSDRATFPSCSINRFSGSDANLVYEYQARFETVFLKPADCLSW